MYLFDFYYLRMLSLFYYLMVRFFFLNGILKRMLSCLVASTVPEEKLFLLCSFVCNGSPAPVNFKICFPFIWLILAWLWCAYFCLFVYLLYFVFIFILLRVPWNSCICGLKKLLFCPILSLSAFWNSCYLCIRWFNFAPQVIEVLFICFNPFFLSL